MIREFSVKSKPSNGYARWMFIISMAGSLALILISTFAPLYKGIFSLAGVTLFAAALVLYTKYILPIYFYDITFDFENTPIFVVRQQAGKKNTTLCRIDLANIVKIEKQNRSERKAHKTPIGTVKYSYLPTLYPSVIYRLSVQSRYEKAEILIESSEEFADLLMSYAAKAREVGNDTDEY